MLVDTIEKVKNVSVGYVGSDGLFDSATVNAYTASLRGLSATQAEVVLSSAGLDSAQRKQIISALEATTATKTLTAEEALSAMARKSGNAEAAKELLIKSQLVTKDQLEAGAEIQVSTAKLKSAVASGALTQSEADNIAVALGLTGTNIGLGQSFKLLTASIWANVKAMAAWLFTTPQGWATLAIGAIVGATAAYIKWGDTLDNTREKLADLKSECDTITSDIESVNNELETTKQRMDELEGKGTLTFTEKEEYDNLVKQNNELQRTIDLLKLEQKEKNKEKNKTFVEAMEKDVNKQDEYSEHTSTGKVSYGYGRSKQDSVAYTSASEMDYINYQFEEIERLKDEKSKASTKAEQDRIQKQIDAISEYLRGKNTEFTTDADGIEYIENPTTEDEKKVNQWLDFISDFQDRMAIAMGGDNAKTNAFNRVVDNWQFDEVVQGLQDLGKEGKVTAEMLDDPKYDAFIQKLVDLGVIDSADALDEIALAFNNVGTEAENSDENVDKITTSLFALKTASESISTLSSAFKELSEDGKITTESILEIQEATGLSGEAWAKYEKTLLTAKKGSAEFNEAMTDLTYKILENKVGLDKLANADESYIASILEENNVLNANEVAHDAVERAKAQQLIQSKLAKGVTKENIIALLNEADSCDITADAYVYLIAQEILFNNNDLSVSQKLQALRDLATQAGLTGAAISSILNAPYGKSGKEQKAWAEEHGFSVSAKRDKNGKIILKNGKQDWVWTDEAGNTYENANEAALSIAGNAFSDALKTEIPVTPQYSVKSAKERAEAEEDYAKKVADINEDLAEKEKQFAEDMAEAWKEEHLEQLKDGLEKHKDVIDQYKKNLEITDFGLDNADENNFGLRSDLLSTKLEQLTTYGQEMRKEFERVASIIPQTGEEAQELAGRIEELGSEMRDNVATIRETQVEIQRLRIDTLASIGSEKADALQAELDNIDKRIDLLTAENSDDFKYTNQILMTDLFLPVKDFSKQRKAKADHDQKLIKEEQETQDTIAWANNKGIIKGVSETEFNLAGGITLQDCYTMVLRALGYKESEELSYPNGYINLAKKLRLGENVEETENKAELTGGDVAIILYNGLYADMKDGEMQQQKFMKTLLQDISQL